MCEYVFQAKPSHIDRYFYKKYCAKTLYSSVNVTWYTDILSIQYSTNQYLEKASHIIRMLITYEPITQNITLALKEWYNLAKQLQAQLFNAKY